jgi:hypothetical protein
MEPWGVAVQQTGMKHFQRKECTVAIIIKADMFHKQ